MDIFRGSNERLISRIMGNLHVREKSDAAMKVVEGLRNKVRHLEGEIGEIMCLRETESEAYERELMVFSIKESEWREERRKLKGEVKKMRKKFNSLDGMFETGNENKLLQNFVDDKATRDETVEKWKELYFAVKFELDDLIHKTSQESVYLTAEEEDYCCTLKEMHNQVKAKEEAIETLQGQLVCMEKRQAKREREMDILKQSLRIMSHRMKPTKVASTNVHMSFKENDGSKRTIV